MSSFSLKNLKVFLSAEGQNYLVELVRDAKRDHGDKWLEALRNEFENVDLIFKTISECSEAEALDTIKEKVPALKYVNFDDQILNLFRKLKAEIER